MNFVRPQSSIAIVWPVAALLLSGPATGLLHAQQAVGLDVQDSQKALQLLSAGKYPEAAKLYEGIPQKYPTSAQIPEAYFRLGYIGFVTGDYDKAVAALQKNIKGKNVPPDVLELSYSFVPQILAAKAGKLQSNDPLRKAAFQAAVKEFDAFIQKYPQSEEVEAANFGKARVLYSIDMFEEAAEALKTNVAKFPQSPSLQDTQFMLALVLGTQANVSMQKATARDTTAEAAYDEAVRLLAEIVSKRTDVALANDAQFQLGETLFARGNYEKKENREPIVKRALLAYRAVLPKEMVVKAQQDRIAQIQQRKTDVFKAGDIAQFRRLQRFLEKEQEKIAGLEERPDQTFTAKLKSAQIFLGLERYDETRVLLRHIESQAEDPEQKKQIAYFMALTYSAQNLTQKGLEYYNKFMGQYKGDPIAENLPLLLGAAFLSTDEPEKAIKYFKEQSAMYPKSPATADAAMREGLALSDLGRFDEAREALAKFLKTNPGKDQAAAAELGIASIYQRTGKGEDALKTYKSVRDKYPGSTEAEQSGYWIGQLTLAKGDAKTALTEIKTFLAKNGQGSLAAAAMLLEGQALATAGDKPGSIKAFQALSAKFPDSRESTAAYFQRAALLQKDNQFDEVTKVMREFINAHPTSDRVYAAYDYIAQIQVTKKALPEAIATYEEFVAKYPKDPEAAKALVRASIHWKKVAEDLGAPTALNEAQRAEWKKDIGNAVTDAEKVLEDHPESSEVSLALQNLLSCQKLMMRLKIKSPAEVEDYFQRFARRFEGKPATRSKILFALAGYLSDKEEKKAVDIMKSAYDEKLVYAPADMDLYGSALIKAKAYDPAQAVYTKLAKDYALPANTPLEKAPKGPISEAQSMTIFGIGKILQEKGKKAEAAAKFAELKANFPGSPKLLEADFGIAQDEVEKKNYDEALKLLKPIAQARQSSTNLQARAMMVIGEIAEKKGDTDAAINNYIKLGTLFPAETEIAPEGLFRGAQLIEKKLSK